MILAAVIVLKKTPSTPAPNAIAGSSAVLPAIASATAAAVVAAAKPSASLATCIGYLEEIRRAKTPDQQKPIHLKFLNFIYRGFGQAIAKELKDPEKATILTILTLLQRPGFVSDTEHDSLKSSVASIVPCLPKANRETIFFWNLLVCLITTLPYKTERQETRGLPPFFMDFGNYLGLGQSATMLSHMSVPFTLTMTKRLEEFLASLIGAQSFGVTMQLAPPPTSSARRTDAEATNPIRHPRILKDLIRLKSGPSQILIVGPGFKTVSGTDISLQQREVAAELHPGSNITVVDPNIPAGFDPKKQLPSTFKIPRPATHLQLYSDTQKQPNRFYAPADTQTYSLVPSGVESFSLEPNSYHAILATYAALYANFGMILDGKPAGPFLLLIKLLSALKAGGTLYFGSLDVCSIFGNGIVDGTVIPLSADKLKQLVNPFLDTSHQIEVVESVDLFELERGSTGSWAFRIRGIVAAG